MKLNTEDLSWSRGSLALAGGSLTDILAGVTVGEEEGFSAACRGQRSGKLLSDDIGT
jgi:hypothetical protein